MQTRIKLSVAIFDGWICRPVLIASWKVRVKVEVYKARLVRDARRKMRLLHIQEAVRKRVVQGSRSIRVTDDFMSHTRLTLQLLRSREDYCSYSLSIIHSLAL
ncbi:hypothetical protein WG66_012661, partial [Moniliophthora roreri]